MFTWFFGHQPSQILFQDPPDRNILQSAGPQLAVESNWSSEGKDGCFFFFLFTLANGSCSIQTTLKVNES